jgi:hypothetical protein
MSSITIDEEIAQLEQLIRDLETGDGCSIRTANEDITNARNQIAQLRKLLFLEEVPFFNEDVYVKIFADDTPALATRNRDIVRAMGQSGQRIIEDTANNLVYTSSGSEVVVKEKVPNQQLDSLVLFILAFNLRVTADTELAIVDQMKGQRQQLTNIITSREHDTLILAG